MEVMRFNLEVWLTARSVPKSLHHLKDPKHLTILQHTMLMPVHKWLATSNCWEQGKGLNYTTH